MSSVIQHYTLIERRRWKFFSTIPRGFSWDYRCELRVLLILLQVKVASSVNSFSGSNWRFVCNQRQKSWCMALSPGCRFWTDCGWNGYKSFSCNAFHTCVRETPIRTESLRVIIVWLPYQELFPVPPCFFLRARSDKTWTLGSWLHSRNILNTLWNTLRSVILSIVKRRRYSSTTAVALPSQKP